MSSILQLGKVPHTRKGVSLISNEFDAFLSEMLPPLWALPVRVPAPQYQEEDCPADGIGGDPRIPALSGPGSA